MLEINRLKPMVANYDPQKFQRIYDQTENLRKKLVSQIDHRRFGVDPEEILSWFTVKFIYAYNKYCEKYNEDILKGHMIRAMQFMKCRILRAAYQNKYSQSIVEYTPNQVKEDYIDPYEDETKDHYFRLLCDFLKERISDNAFMLFQLQLHPPIYVLHEMKLQGIENIHKIPDQIICNYYDLGFDFISVKYLKSLRKEINSALELAKEHFNKN